MSPEPTRERRRYADDDGEDWEDVYGCMCGDGGCPDCGTACTWCGGDGIGDGCYDPIQCCGEDFCHNCRGTGLRANQRVF